MATYTLISSNVLSSSAASVTFSAIPATYTDLVVRLSARDSSAGTNANYGQIILNNDTSSANYSAITVAQFNGTVYSNNYPTSSLGWGIWSYYGFDSAGNTANTFSSSEIYIPSYTASQKKPFSAYTVTEDNTATSGTCIEAIANLYQSTTAISAVTLKTAGTFVSGSSFYLYGISNA